MLFRKNSSQGRHSVEWRKKNSYFGKDEGAHHRSGEKMDHLFWDEGTFLRLYLLCLLGFCLEMFRLKLHEVVLWFHSSCSC